MIYGVLYKIFIGAKRLRIMFSKVDELIRYFSGNKYLALFGSEKCSVVFSRIKYLISVKSCISYIASHNYGKTKILVDDDLLLEETLTLHKVVTLIK